MRRGAHAHYGEGVSRSPAVVVVGAGLAGLRTAACLRTSGFAGHLTLVGDEGLAPYDRPPLSKHLFDRPTPVWLAEDLGLAPAIDDERLGDAAVALAAEGDGYEVRLRSGAALRADGVVLATGARPHNPWPQAWTLHTADDAARLRAALSPGTRLVCVGAGWIGAELAGVCAAAGVDVTVLEAAPTPLFAALGAEVGARTAAWYPAGTLRTGTAVADVTADGVLLDDGEKIPADVVVAAIGVRPASAWLADSPVPLLPDGTVRVDELMRPLLATGEVALPRLRVVGDLATRRSRRHGWVRPGHWDAALRGPEPAAASLVAELAGEHPGDPTTAPDPAPYVFSTQHGHDLALFGAPSPDAEVVLRGDPSDGTGWTALWVSPVDGTTSAILTVDRPRDTAAARRLFAGERLPRIDTDAVRDPANKLTGS